MDAGGSVTVGVPAMILGAGGNIGSHAVPHLARMSGISRLTLVDRDVYETRNLENQDIAPEAVGRPKAVVQAERARALRADLPVEAVVADLESLPLGAFRGHVLLACLDSRRSRQALNEIAWRVGAPLLDAGVLSVDLLTRVDRYDPADRRSACLECAWADEDYAALEVSYPCDPDSGGSPPTGAPSALGALAASVLALECQKVLGRGPSSVEPVPAESAEVGTRIVISAAHHRLLKSRLVPNPACRFDHHAWAIEEIDLHPAECTLGALLTRLRTLLGSDARGGPLRMAVHGRGFLREVVCPACGRFARPLRFVRPELVTTVSDRCASCDGPVEVTGWGLVESLEESDVEEDTRGLTLDALGVRPLDVVTGVAAVHGREVHVQVGNVRSGEVRCA
jgi:molybdopterin/thiamine biosynthesis adenylyltransferase